MPNKRNTTLKSHNTFTSWVEIDYHKFLVLVSCSAVISRENYGSDIDGRRGDMRTIIDDVEIQVTDKRHNNITDKLYANHRWEYDRLVDEAESRFYEDYIRPIDDW